MAKQYGRRGNDKYTPISGEILKELAEQFRLLCAIMKQRQAEVLEEIIRKWVEENKHLLPQPTSQPTNPAIRTISQLVGLNYQQLLSSSIKEERLQAMLKGEQPNSQEITELCHSLGLDEAYVVGLLPPNKKKR